MTGADFHAMTMSNVMNRELQCRLRSIGLRDCYVTAGCLFQTVWNHQCGRPPQWGIKDYDVFYFDDNDLSWEAENQAIQRVAEATADISIAIEVKNQARVHLWYPDRFGSAYPALKSSRDGIDRYLISCTCVGVEVQSGAVYAPNGFGELSQGLLRMNPLCPKPNLFREKAESYRSRWPWLTIMHD